MFNSDQAISFKVTPQQLFTKQRFEGRKSYLWPGVESMHVEIKKETTFVKVS